MHSGLPPLPRGQQRRADVNNSRSVKRGIRGVKDGVNRDGDDLTDIKSTKLTDRVHELNSISKHVERPSEQADDSEVFYTLTQKGAEMAKRVAAGKGRSANDFIRHLKAAYVEALDAQHDGEIDPLAFNWNRLSRRVSKYFKYSPGVSCLLGPLDAEAKVKKQVQRIQRKPVGQVVAPKVLEVEDMEAQEKRETEKNMEVMWAALRKHPDGVGFLELVMNTQSFAQLCENCFTLSFLVHNKRARFAKSETNNNKGLLVFPYNEKTARQDGSAKALDQDRAQFILNYSTADWEEWKRFVKPEDCLMPHRSVHAEDTEATGLGEAGPSNRAEEDDELPDGSSDLPNGRSRDHSAKRNGRSRKRQSRVSVKEELLSEDEDNEEDEDDIKSDDDDEEDDDNDDTQTRKSSKRGGKRRK